MPTSGTATLKLQATDLISSLRGGSGNSALDSALLKVTGAVQRRGQWRERKTYAVDMSNVNQETFSRWKALFIPYRSACLDEFLVIVTSKKTSDTMLPSD